MRGIHRWPVNFLHKLQVTRKMFSFDDVIMLFAYISSKAGNLAPIKSEYSISIQKFVWYELIYMYGRIIWFNPFSCYLANWWICYVKKTFHLCFPPAQENVSILNERQSKLGTLSTRFYWYMTSTYRCYYSEEALYIAKAFSLTSGEERLQNAN